MIWYLVKLAVLLPAIALLAWATLRFGARIQAKLGGVPSAARAARLVETTMLTPALRLAVIEFHGTHILVSYGKGGLTRLAEAPAPAPAPGAGEPA